MKITHHPLFWVGLVMSLLMCAYWTGIIDLRTQPEKPVVEKPVKVEEPVKIEIEKPPIKPPTGLHIVDKENPKVLGVKYDGKVLKAKVSKSALKMKNVKYVLNVGYCSYEGTPDKNGNITIQPEWSPPNSKITFGVFNSDNGKYLSSVKVG